MNTMTKQQSYYVKIAFPTHIYTATVRELGQLSSFLAGKNFIIQTLPIGPDLPKWLKKEINLLMR